MPVQIFSILLFLLVGCGSNEAPVEVAPENTVEQSAKSNAAKPKRPKITGDKATMCAEGCAKRFRVSKQNCGELDPEACAKHLSTRQKQCARECRMKTALSLERSDAKGAPPKGKAESACKATCLEFSKGRLDECMKSKESTPDCKDDIMATVAECVSKCP